MELTTYKGGVMRIEIGDAIVTVAWVPTLRRNETAPGEGGYFEVVEVTGRFTDDEQDGIEERALAEAYDRFEG